MLYTNEGLNHFAKDPAVVYFGGRYLMYYSVKHDDGRFGVGIAFYGGSYNCTPQQIGCAVSEDGVFFRRVSVEPFIPCGAPGSWNSSESGHPYAFRDPVDGRAHLFYQGSSDMGKTWYLSRAEIGFADGKPVVLNK
ncbi:MAG: hypothetical protein IJA83_12575 [Clostridia bacterium]|nr:hypothetical protein [Clostridia bacterium]